MLHRSSLAGGVRIGALFCTLAFCTLPATCAVNPVEESAETPPAEPVAEAQEAVGTTCISIRRGLGAGVVEDAYVTSAHPTDNFGLGYILAGGSPSGVKYGLVRFDLSAVPRGALITSATLRMVLAAGPGSPAGLHRATAAWSEPTVTWSSFNGAFDPALLASFQSAQGPVNANVQGVVQGWVAGAYPNDGFAIDRALTTNAAFNASEDPTATNRPQLDVCYTTPTTFSGNVNGLYKTFSGSQAVRGSHLALDGANRPVFVADMTIGGTADFGGGVMAPENGVGAGNVVVKLKGDGSLAFSVPINWGDITALGSDTAGNTVMVVSCSYYNPAGCAFDTTPLPGHSVVKLDQAGHIVWVRPTTLFAGLWVAPAGDVFVLESDPFYYAVPQALKKLDAAGNTVFNTTLGYHIRGAALGPHGDFFMTANGVVTFAGTPVAGDFLAKLSPSGVEQWAATSGVRAGGIVVDPWDRPATIFAETVFDYYLDDFVTVRTFVDRFDATGAPRSSSVLGSSPANLSVTSAAFDATGSLILSGVAWGVPTMNLGGADIPLFSCDPAWSDYDQCNNFSTYYGFAGTDAFLLKQDGDGNHISSTIFGDPAMQSIGSVVVDSLNRVEAIGSFSSSGTPAHFHFPTANFLDLYLTRYNF
jgi:hypothetical protein